MARVAAGVKTDFKETIVWGSVLMAAQRGLFATAMKVGQELAVTTPVLVSPVTLFAKGMEFVDGGISMRRAHAFVTQITTQLIVPFFVQLRNANHNHTILSTANATT